PGIDFDPEKAARGEKAFRQRRKVVDPSGEFSPNVKLACDTCHSGPLFTDNKPHRIEFMPFGDPGTDPGELDRDGNALGFDTPALIGLRFTAPYFHDGVAGDPSTPGNVLGGVGAAQSEPVAADPAVARRALRNVVLPFYNNVRFEFGFSQQDLDDLTEFLL